MNEKQTTFSSRFPGLVRLAADLAKQPETISGDSFNLFCHNFSQALLAPVMKDGLQQVQQALSQWLDCSQAPDEDFQDLFSTLANYQIATPELFAHIAEQSVLSGQGLALVQNMQRAAEKTGHPLLYFVAGWIWLNLDQLDACIRICKKVRHSYGPLQSLLGQALLESGRPDKACQALELAVKMSPDDVLAWFLLSKSHLTSGQPEAAWKCIEVCLRLAPGHIEITTMMGLIACHENQVEGELMQSAWEEIYQTWQNSPNSGVVTCLLYQLAFRLKDRHKAQLITTRANWARLASDSDFLSNIGSLLRAFHSYQWTEENRLFLEKVTAKVNLAS